MRLQIVSDLHLEAPVAYNTYEISTENARHLALFGDIGHVQDPGLFQFLTKQLLRFATVFFVCGNHEPYHSNWPTAIEKISEFGERSNSERRNNPDMGEFVLLHRTRYDLSTSVTILGCTLFSSVQKEQSNHVTFGLKDFYYIKGWTVEQHCEAHMRDVSWLKDQVSAISNAEPNRQIVILTHYSPTIDSRSIDPAHRKSDKSSGFSTDLSKQACWDNNAVKLWAFGHTHFNCDFNMDGKRLFANQRGYYSA